MKQHPLLCSPGQNPTLHLTPYLAAGEADSQLLTGAWKQQQKITTAEPMPVITVSAQSEKTKMFKSSVFALNLQLNLGLTCKTDPVLRCCLLHPSAGSELVANRPSCLRPQISPSASHDRSDKDSCGRRSCDTRIVLSQCLETCAARKQHVEQKGGERACTSAHQQGAFEALRLHL